MSFYNRSNRSEWIVRLVSVVSRVCEYNSARVSRQTRLRSIPREGMDKQSVSTPPHLVRQSLRRDSRAIKAKWPGQTSIRKSARGESVYTRRGSSPWLPRIEGKHRHSNICRSVQTVPALFHGATMCKFNLPRSPENKQTPNTRVHVHTGRPRANPLYGEVVSRGFVPRFPFPGAR